MISIYTGFRGSDARDEAMIFANDSEDNAASLLAETIEKNTSPRRYYSGRCLDAVWTLEVKKTPRRYWSGRSWTLWTLFCIPFLENERKLLMSLPSNSSQPRSSTRQAQAPQTRRRPLIRRYARYDQHTLEDLLALLAANVEDAFLLTGAEPGKDYTHLTTVPDMIPSNMTKVARQCARAKDDMAAPLNGSCVCDYGTQHGTKGDVFRHYRKVDHAGCALLQCDN